MFKVNIQKYLKREINRSEVALLRAEDELLNAQMAVNAHRSRIKRLKGRLAKTQQYDEAEVGYEAARADAERFAEAHPGRPIPMHIIKAMGPTPHIRESRWVRLARKLAGA